MSSRGGGRAYSYYGKCAVVGEFVFGNSPSPPNLFLSLAIIQIIYFYINKFVYKVMAYLMASR